ncbi:TIGR00266 family protein [Flammeovirga pectinis]|uniref:TIGR00266 family protein n=1 Tax=Flammeovirga pectinis TaxID=2494373 RepID=A0A3S9P6L5_9BACT|nr:TIGR00266 family protein [Flammeovirga pectinis]AZQ63838.1 TIGR00266 family protein [Flammeovirga pectinis]
MEEVVNKELEYRFDCKPDFGLITVQIPSGDKLKVEASAMATMDTNIEMKTKVKGGLSRFFSGESIFINEFEAKNGAGQIQIAPGAPGDVEHVLLNDETIYLQSSAFVASALSVDVDAKFQGIKRGFFSGESLFLIKCSGNGDLWFNSYGGIIEIDVEDGYVVDTGHIVAFTESLNYDIYSVGGYKSLFFSGEGLVCRFSGRGKIWIQTRKIAPFVNWINPFRPRKNNN